MLILPIILAIVLRASLPARAQPLIVKKLDNNVRLLAGLLDRVTHTHAFIVLGKHLQFPRAMESVSGRG